MLNTQPSESLVNSDGETLDYIDIWKTMQGEGPFAGMPSVFIRLAGCNLQCPLCDTEYTLNRRATSIAWLAAKANELSKYQGDRQYHNRLVVITGGEPFRQNIDPLCGILSSYGLQVQIETNGTIWRELTTNPHIVVSPKAPKVHAAIASRATAWKYVLEAGKIDPRDGLPLSVLGNNHRVARPVGNAPIYVQPMDEQDPVKNDAHLKATIEVAMKFNYRLCIQTHKLIGMP